MDGDHQQGPAPPVPSARDVCVTPGARVRGQCCPGIPASQPQAFGRATPPHLLPQRQAWHLRGSSKARVVRSGQRLPKVGEGMPNGVFWHRQQGLLQVLKAYTLYRPEQGYCQAQGPVAAVLLMHLPPEVSAPDPALGTRDSDLPNLTHLVPNPRDSEFVYLGPLIPNPSDPGPL